jgi:hypothetical protein
MKKSRIFLLGMLAVLLTFGLVPAGCDNGTTGNDGNGGNNNNNGGNNNNGNNSGNNNANPLVGTWVGFVMGSQATVVISSGNTWTLSVPGENFYDNGSYSGSGSTATLTSSGAGGAVVGTATSNISISGTITITLVLNQNSEAPGTYTLTKQ